MKRLLTGILVFLSWPLFAADEPTCSHWLSFIQPACQRLHQIWTEGSTDLYLSGYAWHNRYTYSPERIKRYNENAWGGGLGKGLFDEKGNWHGLYAIAFLDSHSDVEPTAGYAYLKVASLNEDVKAGIGFTLLVTARSDINHYIPFPGALPWASVFFKKATLAATYIPGSSTNGNVLFILGKYSF
jgi:palmitoyl transferase